MSDADRAEGATPLAAAPAGQRSFREEREQWARPLVADRKLMRAELRALRKANREWLESTDERKRATAEWWCSEQRILDSIDSACWWDHPDDDDYAGGGPICHPDYGPRQTQEDVCDVVRDLRRAAAAVFPSRLDLDRCHAEVCRLIIERPASEWGEGWSDAHWVAHLYKNGMRCIDAVVRALSDGNWPHVVHMLKATIEHARAMEYAPLRTRLKGIRRAEPFLVQRGHNKGKTHPKTQFFIQLKQRFPEKGPKALAEFISTHAKSDEQVGQHFRVENFRLIDRATGKPVDEKRLAEQIRKAK